MQDNLAGFALRRRGRKVAKDRRKNARTASLQKKGESWYCQFLYHEKRHTFTIGKVEPDEAESKANQVDYLLMRIRQGRLTVLPETDIMFFLQHDGKPPERGSP